MPFHVPPKIDSFFWRRKKLTLSPSHFSENFLFFRWKFGSRTGEQRTSGRSPRTGCPLRITREEPKKETWRGTITWSTTRRRRTTSTTISNIPTTLMNPLLLLLLTMYRVLWVLTGALLRPKCGHQPMRMHLVPNQHFASPMIDYFLLSRVPKKFRIELFALNICRWIIRA